MRLSFAVVCAVGVAVLSSSIHSAARAQDPSFAGPEWRPIDLDKAVAAARQITPAKYPDCDFALVDQRSVRDYHVDGTGAEQDETFTKVLTEKGKQENRAQAFSYLLPYSTEDVAKVEVIKPNGDIVPVDVAANSKDAIDDSQMAENIYDPNSHIISVNIPRLDIGDVVHVIARQINHRSIVPNEFEDENVFEGGGYVRHISYIVHAPKSLPLVSVALRDKIPGTITENTMSKGAAITYDWEINNVPRMFDEPAMPPYQEVLERLFVSTTANWRYISQWYWNLSEPHLAKTTPEMKENVLVLTASAPTDLDKIRALYYFVAKRIRYMGLTPEKNRPGFEPHDVSLTFDKKYGVCRDKAGLLVAMLRLAGFKAYPVLINIGSLLDPKVPEVGFDHAIVAVELTKGRYTLMDPTDDQSRDLLPSYDCHRSYLVCRPEGDTLRVSPVPSPDRHMLSVTTTGTLGADGVLNAVSELSFGGVNDDAWRAFLSRAKPDQRQDVFESRIKSLIPGVKLTAIKITPAVITDTSIPLHVELRYSAVGLTANGGGESVVSLPWISRRFAVTDMILGGDVGLQKRKYPLDTMTTCGVHEALSLKLVGGFARPLSLPKSSTADEAIGYHESVRIADGTLEGTREFKLGTIEYSPVQYLQLKQALKDQDYDGRKNLIMALKQTNVAEAMTAGKDPVDPAPASNYVLLNSVKSLEVVDAHTAVLHGKYSMKILTYDGKMSEAEVKINYDPACEDAKIVHASVVSNTGARQDIAPDEINVMDQGWDATAKRYTAGKVLVASLPGVDVGSTINVEYEITMKNMPFICGFEPFQIANDIDSKQFDIKAPGSVKVRTMVTGAGGIVKASEGTSLEWTAGSVKALAAESNLPPEWNFEAGVGYFVGDAGAYWNSLSDAMTAHAQNCADAAKVAGGIAGAAASTPRGQVRAIRAIRDYIAENIRVAGPSFTDLPLSELSDADTTLKDGYGHAADCAILYYAMLSAAGFHPEFVMGSSLPAIDGFTHTTQSFPLPNDFSMPLVKVAVNGQDYYLNDTDQYAHLGTTGYDGKLGVSLADGHVMTIHAAKDCGNKTETAYALALTESGKARIEVSNFYYGQGYNSKKKYFAELQPEDRDHYFQEAVSGVAQGARPVGGLTTDFDTYPGVERYAVELDNYAVVDGKYLYFDLPFQASLFGPIPNRRSLPMYFQNESERILKADIELPSGYKETDIVPVARRFAAPGGSLANITQTNVAGKCSVTEDLETMPGVIQPASYPDLLTIQSELGQKSGTMFLLKRE